MPIMGGIDPEAYVLEGDFALTVLCKTCGKRFTLYQSDLTAGDVVIAIEQHHDTYHRT